MAFLLGEFMRHSIVASVSFVASCVLMNACDWNSKEDYHPKQGYESFLQQQVDAKAAAEKSGKGEVAALAEPGKQSFETYCVACHGANGKADGPAALAMNPKPRNFTDKTWQAKVNDEHVAKVIREGGASVGLSATMGPWGSVLNEGEIKNVVQYVRAFSKK